MIDRLSSSFFRLDDPLGDADRRSRRANRRRALVFGVVFAVLAIGGLIYDFARPALYEATALINFAPASASSASGDRPYQLRDEVQYMTSTPLLQTVWEGLKDTSVASAGPQTSDPPAALQGMLVATQVAGTNVVSVRAQGADPAFLAPFVNRVVADYRAGLDERFRSGSSTAIAEADDETKKLDATVTEKRIALDAFRARNNIVSGEHDDNQLLTEIKGTATALNTANEKVAGAEAKLSSLKAAAAAGQPVITGGDNPTLISLQQQASAIRLELRETGRTFTQDYMAIDPRFKAMRARLNDLEEQIVAQRKASQHDAVGEATQEVATARAAALALRQQLAANQGGVQRFTTRFNEYKSKQEELTHLEQLRQKSNDRLATLQASELGRKPKIEIVEPATRPQSPASPAYARDALISVVGALVVALLTMGIVELFNRPPSLPTTVVVPQPFTAMGLAERPTALPMAPMRTAITARNATSLEPDGASSVSARLSAPLALPRELGDAEVARLLDAADPTARGAMTLLLSGVAPHEVVALLRGDIRRDLRSVAITGVHPRIVPLAWPVLNALPDGTEPADESLLHSSPGRPMSEADLATATLYAAHDAGIENADEVTPEALRHTYISFLMRQGMRFSELARVVGPLPAERLSAYKRLVPSGVGNGAVDDKINPVFPVLRALS